MSAGKVMLGILAGVTAGVLGGILLAPDKGTRTRRKILKKAESFTESLKEKFNDLVDTVNEKVENAKEEVSDFAEKKMGKAEKTFKNKKTTAAQE